MLKPFWWLYESVRPLIISWDPEWMMVQAWAFIVIALVANASTVLISDLRWRLIMIVSAYIIAYAGMLIAGHAGEMIEIEQIRRLIANG